MFAIVGLGNPGKEYEMTRHNVGFIVLQALAQELGATFKKESRFEGWRAKSQEFELLLPATYMNESGRSCQKLLHYFQIDPSHLLVVVDDMHLPFGQMRLRAFGSAGGHNGLKSIEKELGTNHYMRLRVGIGRARESHVDHVLGKFSQEEQKALGPLVDKAVTFLRRLPVDGFSKVATELNQKYLQNEEQV